VPAPAIGRGRIGGAKGVWRRRARDEAIAAPRDGLDESGCIGRVTEGVAQSLDRGVQPVFEIDECVGRPEAIAQLFPCDRLSPAFEQHCQDAKGLLAKINRRPVPAQLPGARVQLELAKPDARLGRQERSHGLRRGHLSMVEV
jgi:hypothetical protein